MKIPTMLLSFLKLLIYKKMETIQTILNHLFMFIYRAWQGLRNLADPALEGNPYKINGFGDSYKANKPFVLHKPSFLSRRRGFI